MVDVERNPGIPEGIESSGSVEDLENRFSHVRPTIVGAGHVWSRYKQWANHLGVINRDVHDPFLNRSVLGEKDNPVEFFPDIDKTRPVMILSPSVHHVDQIGQFVRMGVPGIYCEKPCAISGTDQARLDEIIRENPDVPVFFADHYYYKHLALFALMGVENIPFKGHVKITEDPTGRLQKAMDSGKPILGDIVSIEAALVKGQGAAATIDHRKWLGVRESGGGMLLDLLVHLNDGVQVLGHEVSEIDSVFLGTHTDVRGKYTEIKNGDHKRTEDYAEVNGVTKDGVNVKFRVGKFADEDAEFMLIKGENGSLRVDYSKTNTVTVMDKDGIVVGKAEIASDPFLLSAAHGFEHITKRKGPHFYGEQRNSVLLIQKIQEMARGVPDIPEEPARMLIESENGGFEVTEKGGKVISWRVKNSRGEFQEILFQGAEKRTGMPMLFPWYRKNGNFAQHGFGRDSMWTIVDSGERQVIMRLNSLDLQPEFKAMYPYDFESEIRVEIDDKGNMAYNLSVKNTGDSDLPLSPGLHPNFALAHIDKTGIKIKGIEDFNAEGFDWDNSPPDNPYPFNGEVTAVMPGREISIEDISPQGPQTRFWNVWSDKNPANRDFVAVEPLCGLDDAITKDPIKVLPGKTWNWRIKFSASFV